MTPGWRGVSAIGSSGSQAMLMGQKHIVRISKDKNKTNSSKMTGHYDERSPVTSGNSKHQVGRWIHLWSVCIAGMRTLSLVPRAHIRNNECGPAYLWSQCREGWEKRSPGAPWPAYLAKSVSTRLNEWPKSNYLVTGSSWGTEVNLWLPCAQHTCINSPTNTWTHTYTGIPTHKSEF